MTSGLDRPRRSDSIKSDFHAQLGAGVGKEQAVEVAASFFDSGMRAFKEGKYEEAITLFEQSLCITEKYMSPGSIGLATCLNNIAAVYDKMGHYDDAVALYNRALAVLTGTSSNTSDSSVVWNEQRIKAVQHVKAKLESMPRSQEPKVGTGVDVEDVLQIATKIWNEGMEQFKSGKLPEALASFQQVLAINQKYSPGGAEGLATNLNNIGAVQEKMGDLAAAKVSFQEALHVLKDEGLQDDHEKVQHVKQKLAGVAALQQGTQGTQGSKQAELPATQISASPAAETTTEISASPAAEVTTTELVVKGMSCSGCQGKVAKALLAVEGVNSATVDLESGVAVITGTATLEALVASVEGVGKQASVPG